jgi:hypothetical protein
MRLGLWFCTEECSQKLVCGYPGWFVDAMSKIDRAEAAIIADGLEEADGRQSR